MSIEADGSLALTRLFAGEIDAVIFAAGDYFVQFAGTRDELRCEAVGDEYLRKALQFEQLQVLTRLGFFPPERGGPGNHWQDLRHGNAGEAARLAVEALTTVYAGDAAKIEITLV